MLEELQQIDTSAIEELSQIKKDQLVLRSRLEKMRSKRSVVSQEVFDRVYADYEERNNELEDQARPLKEQARSEYAKLRAVHDQCESDLEAARLSKEELEFRHELGEYTEDEFNEKLEETKTLLEKCVADLADAQKLIERFVEAFHTREELEASEEGEEEAGGEEGGEETESAPDDAAPSELEPAEDEELEAEPLDDEVESLEDELDGTEEEPVRTDTEAIPVVTAAVDEPFEAVEAEDMDGGATVEEPDPDQVPPPAPAPPPLEESSPTVAESPEEPEGATLIAAGPRLVAKFEDGSELEYTIGVRPTTIGRAPGNVIEVAGDSVSRRHAEIALTGDGYVVRDLETRNGTWVNGERLAEERVLTDGDLVQIGAVVFVFRGR